MWAAVGVGIRRRNLQGKENIREEGAEAAWTGHVGVHCVGHFPLPARAEEGAPGASLRGSAASFSGRAWHLRVFAWDRDVSGFGGITGTVGEDEGKTEDGSDIDSFVSAITGLTEGTVYYCRAYAINAVGIA